MAGKYKELAEVLKQECIAPDIYSMWLQTDKIAEQAVPGQFISVYSNDGSRLLPRPISLCEIDKDKKALSYCLSCGQEKEQRSLHSISKAIRSKS